MSKQHEVTVQNIHSAIITLPNRPPAMLASQAAILYEVETRQLNQAVSRNQERFPDDFIFQLTTDEISLLKMQLANDAFWSQTVTKIYGGDDKRPWMLTRNGMNQLSGVLKSDVAIKRSIQICRAFSAFEEMFQQDQEGRPALYTMVKTVELLHYAQYYHEGRGKMCALPLSAEDAEGMKRDILCGMKTAQVAKKYNRAKSTVKKHTKIERARIVLEKSGQMALPFTGGNA